MKKHNKKISTNRISVGVRVDKDLHDVLILALDKPFSVIVRDALYQVYIESGWLDNLVESFKDEEPFNFKGFLQEMLQDLE